MKAGQICTYKVKHVFLWKHNSMRGLYHMKMNEGAQNFLLLLNTTCILSASPPLFFQVTKCNATALHLRP